MKTKLMIREERVMEKVALIVGWLVGYGGNGRLLRVEPTCCSLSGEVEEGVLKNSVN